MDTHVVILTLHSWFRWIALIAGVAATIAAGARPGSSGPSGTSHADRWGLALMATLDLQMLLGLLMYLVVSPTIAQIRANFGAAMKDPAARFWAVEHLSMMMVAVIVVHVGRVLARKAASPDAKRMRLLVCFGVATVLMFLAIPWPGMRAGRPLFRF